MRVLSLGIALPDSSVDNYDWASALSFFDYDAIVVDPAAAVSSMIESVTGTGGAYTAYTEEPVENGPTTATGVGLADLLRRRQEETERLLGKGGLVVCFAYPDVPHPRVAGFTGCHRYYWLPAPPGASYAPPYLKAAAGTEVRPTDYEHPFADFLEKYRSSVLYRAIFGEGLAGFGEHGSVIGRSPGGAAVAMDLRVGGGRVVFLPALPDRLATSERNSIASSIVGCIRNTLLLSSEGPAPGWIGDFSLPGLQAAQERVDGATGQLEAAETELEEARNEYRGIDRYRRILWQEGKYGLELPVRDCLTLLGFRTYARSDEPAAFYDGSDLLFVETEGSVAAVGMDPHYRLRQRLEVRIAKGERPLGLIVVNGYRELSPGSRPQQYDNSLRVAAEAMRYCVLETKALFEAVEAKLSGDEAAVKAFCERLVATEGVFATETPREAGEGEEVNEQ